ncbi:WecB/TagA/CpsF family glycosyltransferase [Microbacterium jiangjiandongii]|uniref:WecB/TagA/CpsF family glycosyltransferase n=1 Tax=Microbacterium jiangjiandongii TaxID=3049071 RepID=UPI00214B5D27|nr:WecB/TagA/CpsF family glycosyltransferase [Microbacterium sp. zg.Y843]MCR2815875.1 WecB/TagA/CpsF family glycosyltransferase [Microbacterium sp. zg.Y843]
MTVPLLPQLPARVRIPLFDVEVTPLTSSETVELILERVRSGQGLVIGNLNLHGVYVAHVDREFRQYCDASDLVLVDGAPVAMAAGLGPRYRVGSTDWLDELMPVAEGLRILAIGGTEASARGAQRHMTTKYPRVTWDAADGFSTHHISDDLRSRIEQAQIILVGMGMPQQERWLLSNSDLLRGKVVANVGGCIDYYAGTQRLAPRWTGKLGIEWLYRLLRDPRRLAHRYLIEPFKLVRILAAKKRPGRGQ